MSTVRISSLSNISTLMDLFITTREPVTTMLTMKSLFLDKDKFRSSIMQRQPKWPQHKVWVLTETVLINIVDKTLTNSRIFINAKRTKFWIKTMQTLIQSNYLALIMGREVTLRA